MMVVELVVVLVVVLMKLVVVLMKLVVEVDVRGGFEEDELGAGARSDGARTEIGPK